MCFGASSRAATCDLVWVVASASAFVLFCNCRGSACAVVLWLAANCAVPRLRQPTRGTAADVGFAGRAGDGACRCAVHACDGAGQTCTMCGWRRTRSRICARRSMAAGAWTAMCCRTWRAGRCARDGCERWCPSPRWRCGMHGYLRPSGSPCCRWVPTTRRWTRCRCSRGTSTKKCGRRPRRRRVTSCLVRCRQF